MLAPHGETKWGTSCTGEGGPAHVASLLVASVASVASVEAAAALSSPEVLQRARCARSRPRLFGMSGALGTASGVSQVRLPEGLDWPV